MKISENMSSKTKPNEYVNVTFVLCVVGCIHSASYTQGRSEEDSNNDLLGKPDQMPGGVGGPTS